MAKKTRTARTSSKRKAKTSAGAGKTKTAGKKTVKKKKVVKKVVKKKKAAKAARPKKKSVKSSAAKSKVSKSKPSKSSASKSAPRRSATKKPASKKPASLETELKRLDNEILKLINRRTQLTTRQLTEHPELKFSPQYDDELWQSLASMNHGPLPLGAVRGVFRELISAARQGVKQQRVAYLGPAFSFTHLASIQRFGQSADLLPVRTIAAVFEEVNRGHADYGVVPIENSTDGRVVDTLDMFTRLPLRICGEIQISIHHNLLARCLRGEITEIYSKPQALSQCRDWLAKNMPQARLIEVTSTSTAAQLARDKPGAAAVASQQAAVEHGLDVIAGDIQDNRENVTRFAVIGDEQSRPSGKDRTAILLQIAHRPGALSDALVAFKNSKVNLTWIESFPLRGPEPGYLFFLDFEGHVHDSKVQRMMKQLEASAVRIEVLGSYPRSEPLD